MENDFTAIFIEETNELLEELEASLMEIEKDPENMDLIRKIFRAIHTIKGSGAMFGFNKISAFAHEVEDVFDLIRDGDAKVSKEIIDLTLASLDHIKKLIERGEKIDPEEEAEGTKIVAGLKQVVPKTQKISASDEAKDQPPPAAEEPLETTYRIMFRPHKDAITKGLDISSVVDEIRNLGSTSVVARTEDIPELNEFDPQISYVAWDILVTCKKGINAVKDVFIFVDQHAEVKIDIIDDGVEIDDEYKKLGHILVERGDLKVEDMDNALKKQPRFGEILQQEGIIEPEIIESALIEQKHVRQERQKRRETDASTSIRVSSEKVDLLVNLVGELVTLQARLSEFSGLMDNSELLTLSEELERMVWELRDNTMEMRMLPIGTTFSRFRRLVRDMANNMKKEIELTTSGGETELDKSVIEKLGDPLVHIIRNCIDHGIELPEQRLKYNKERIGNIHLSAFHSGGYVVIQVSDDGAGLDTEAILKKAFERGILNEGRELSDKEIFSLIFEPGFSTAKTITDISGRGVGMDVVKKNVEALRGHIDVESKVGEGTTITLKIPLTLAIIEGLLVMIAKDYYVIPLSDVEECIEIEHKKIEKDRGQHYVNVRGEIVPYVYLREEFSMSDETAPDLEQIVITRINLDRIGFVVDRVIGEHQTVIKSLGKFYKDVKGIAGATVLGDGTIALILDLDYLLDIKDKKEKEKK